MAEAEQALAAVDPELPAEERDPTGAAERGMSQFLAPVLQPEEDEAERSLRPRRLADFVGQERVKEQLGDRARGGERPR